VIMNFELKSVSLAQSSRLAVDALLVVVPDAWKVDKPADDPLSLLLRQVTEHGDLDKGAGKHLLCYRPEGFKAARLLLVRAGNGQPAEVRKAMAAAMGQLRQPGLRRLGVVLCALDDVAAKLAPAMAAVADACY